MLGYEPPQPRYWKALLVVAPCVAIVAWSLPLLHIRMPLAIVIAGAVLAAFGLAGLVHYRMVDDWRSSWEMNLQTFDKRTSVSKNIWLNKK